MVHHILSPNNNDQYFWYKEGIHFPLASTYNFTSSSSAPTSGGFYTNLSVGIKENLLLSNDILITPNPVTEKAIITFSLKKSSNVSLSILNTIGEEVGSRYTYQNLMGRQSLTLDLDNLSKGIYFVKIQAEGEIATEKIIIQ